MLKIASHSPFNWKIVKVLFNVVWHPVCWKSPISQFNFPLVTGYENIKAKDDYVLSYNRRLRLANWVSEVIFCLLTLTVIDRVGWTQLTIVFFTAVNHNNGDNRQMLKMVETNKMVEIYQSQPTTDVTLAFELIEVNFCFLRCLPRWIEWQSVTSQIFKFAKLWNLISYSEEACQKTSTCQKISSPLQFVAEI